MANEAVDARRSNASANEKCSTSNNPAGRGDKRAKLLCQAGAQATRAQWQTRLQHVTEAQIQMKREAQIQMVMGSGSTISDCLCCLCLGKCRYGPMLGCSANLEAKCTSPALIRYSRP